MWLCLTLFSVSAAVTTSNMLELWDIVEGEQETITRRLVEAVGANMLAAKVLELAPSTVA